MVLVFILYESHKVICSMHRKRSGDSSKSRIFFPHCNFPLICCLELFMRGQRQDICPEP